MQFETGFVSAFKASPFGFTLPVAPPPPPQVLPGDVHFLVDFFNQFLRDASLTPSQRRNLVAIHERLSGTQKELPPSVALSGAAWMRAFTERDQDGVRQHGNAFLEAVALGGDIPGASELQAAINAFTVSILGYLEGGPVPGGATTGSTDGAGASKTDDSAIEWVEPDPDRFYVLDKRSGAVLASVLEDLRNVDRHLARGARPPTRMFFTGAPGNGKTEGAKHIAAQLGKVLAIVRLDALLSKWLGETASNLRRAAEAAMARDAVLLLDEIDAIGGRRDHAAGDAGAGDHTVKVVGAMNQLVDNLPPNFILIGASNLPTLVDPSVVRRLRRTVAFENPDRTTRIAMLTHYWRRAPHTSEAFEAMIRGTEDRSGAALESAADTANLAAGRRGEDELITETDALTALGSMPREVRLGEKPSGLVVVGR